MQDEAVIDLGEKVDLVGHKNRLYRTKVEDIIENGLFLVGIPRFGGVPMPLHSGEDVYMVFYRETGRYITQMNTVGFEKREEIRYAWLFQKSEPYKDQRREAFRVPVSLDVQVCEYNEDAESRIPLFGDIEVADLIEETSSRDLSVTGIAILSKKDYEPGDRKLLRVFLDGQDGARTPFLTCATVVRSVPYLESGKFQIGMNFFGHTKKMNESITKYVLEEQRKQLRQRRLGKAN